MSKAMTKEKGDALEAEFGNVSAEQLLDKVQLQEYETVVRALKCLYENTNNENEQQQIASIARRYENKCLGMLYVADRLYGDGQNEFTGNYLDKQ